MPNKEERVFVDTNIFVRYFTKDDKRKAAKIRRLFIGASRRGLPLVTNLWVLAEIEFILRRQYDLNKRGVLALLHSIFTLDGLTVYDEKWAQLTLEVFENYNIDFVDAINSAFMKQKKISSLYSFDNHFDKVENVTRLTP